MTEPQFDRRQLFGLLGGVAGLALMPTHARAMMQAADRFPGLRTYINDYVSSRRLPGLIAAVGQGSRPLTTVAAGTIANDSATAVDEDTLWRLYSQTKPVTGIALMTLVDRRRLTLDTPIAEFLPRFANVRVLTRPDAPLDETVALARPITVRHLLTHTAGLAYGLNTSTPLDQMMIERRLVAGQVSRLSLPGVNNGRTFGPLDRWADALAELPLSSQPGTRWSYSVSLDLAGRLIEVVSGMSFERYLQETLFGPLGMDSTHFRVPDAQVARLATNYAPVGGTLLPIDPGSTSIYRDAPAFAFGGAGLVGSARDYDRFLAMLLGQGRLGRTRIMSAATTRLAMSNILPEGATTTGTFVDGQGFGAGGRVSLPNSPMGAGLFGWGGAAGTIGFVHTARGVRFGGYANYMPPETYDFQRRVGEVAMADLATRRR